MAMENNTSVYSFTPTQAGLNQFYDLHLSALTSRRYHGELLGKLQRLNSILEALTALTSSAAIASLVFWKLAGGIYFYGLLSAAAAPPARRRTPATH
jgi:hypothetical protein